MQPILRPAEMEAFKNMDLRGWSTKVIDATWPLSEGTVGLESALQRICDEASAAIEAGFQFIVLSDRAQGALFACMTLGSVFGGCALSCSWLMTEMHSILSLCVYASHLSNLHGT